MFIKAILSVFFAVSFSVIFTNQVYADCASFAIEDFDPTGYQAIYIGEPIFEVSQKDKNAQLIKISKVYDGFPNSTEWVHFIEPEASDDCYPRPSTLHTKELYLVAEYVVGSDFTSQSYVVEKFEIGSDQYKGVLKAIEKYNKKNDLPDGKIEVITRKEQQELIETKIQTFIDEVKLLLKEYHQLTNEEASLKDDTCEGNTETQMLACLTNKNKVTESNISLNLTKLKGTLATDEAELWKTLEHSQEVWRSYRDASCDVETYYSRNRTAYSTYRTRCLLLMNQDRSAYLQKMIENP